jgi:glycosyltransferase involved in cell wall biosynthesis
MLKIQQDQKTPLVSIGIPTFNRPNGLRRTLECITAQTYRNIEIIVSDNCTPGLDVQEVMQQFMNEDQRIQFHRQEVNKGAEFNFQFVLEQANGDYFIWAADDDLCKPDMVEMLVSAMEANSNAVLCGCDIIVIDENDREIRRERMESIYKEEEWKRVRYKFFLYPTSNIFFTIYGLYKTEILLKQREGLLTGWSGYGTNMEVPFLASLACMGEIIAIPYALKFYRSHNDSIYTREMATISWVDHFMIAAYVRMKLFGYALDSGLPFLEKIGLFKAIITSMLKSQVLSLYGYITRCVPANLRKPAKKIKKILFHRFKRNP